MLPGIVLTCLQRTPLLKRCVAPVRPENRLVFVGGKYVEFSGLDAVVPESFCDNTLTTAKYTPWNFVFKNLYEQFMRIANFYFLIVAIIMFGIPDTPVSPLTSALPLGFVLVTTAIKQAYEDWLRRKEDKVVNSTPCTLVKDGKFRTVSSHSIKVGDIVRVVDNEPIPCDLVLLSSSDKQGKCSIQTANLDGETNLKTFLCLPETQKCDTLEKLSALQGVIDCQQPITDLYRFVGKMTIYADHPSPVTKALQAQNVLLRGAKLKNTDYVYGCAIYTGHDTKLALNSAIKSGKRSCIERRLNTFLIVFVLYMFIQCGISAALRHVSLAKEWRSGDSRPQWYIPFLFDYNNNEGTITARQAFFDFLYFYVIYNYVIPISLYVTIELQKFVGSIFFAFDINLYDERINENAKANTSDLNEELGQVEYLFCDKTGTLTENDMQFRQCSIKGQLYMDQGGRFVRNYPLEAKMVAGKELQRNNSHNRKSTFNGEEESVAKRRADSKRSDALDKVDGAVDTTAFFEVLSLCHTVQIEAAAGADQGDEVDGDGGCYEYHASSPDEKALLEACRLFGVVYRGSVDNKQCVTFHGKMRRFTLHQVLEFDSERKCMSIIIETDKGEYLVLCKGAESSVLKKCIDGPIDETMEHVNYYASLGLRTLVIASKTLDEAEFTRLLDLIETAKQDLTNRDEALVRAYDEVESGLVVIGATAVEDKLQDGVPETIEKLRIAGIKVWVLTGDKEETAVNISYSAGHIGESMALLRFTSQITEAGANSTLLELKDRIEVLERDHKEIALVVDGASLAMILTMYSEDFRDVCLACSAVLCCRMTPIQKAKVVKLVKDSSTKPTTAAIGDGANDVSMIQEAHVGIGIMGKEGRQASRSSDYAFGRFRFLLRTFLVHGHFYYVRLAVLVQYFFFKNVAFITANFFFIFFSAYSAMSVFDTIFLTFYNVTFTSLPVYLYGLFEQHIPPTVLEDNPKLYRNIRKNSVMNTPRFIMWTMLGFWHSTVSSFGIYMIYLSHDAFSRNGMQTDMAAYGSAIIFICTTAVNVKLMIATYYWTWVTVAGYLITFIGNWSMVAIYSRWAPQFTPDVTSMAGILGMLWSSGEFWLTALLLIVVAVLPDIVIRAYNDMSNPVYITIARSRASKSPAPSKHVMFINSDESISICDTKRRVSPSKSQSGISVIGHRYVGDEPNLAFGGGGGGMKQTGYSNHALEPDK